MWGLILIPFLDSIIPYAARNLVRELYISVHPILLCNASKILSDLLGRRIEVAPVRVRVEGVLVAVSWDIARTTLHTVCVSSSKAKRGVYLDICSPTTLHLHPHSSRISEGQHSSDAVVSLSQDKSPSTQPQQPSPSTAANSQLVRP